MRAYEILTEYAFPDIQKVVLKQAPRQYHRGQYGATARKKDFVPGVVNRGAEHLGTGKFSSTYSTKSPDHVRKISRPIRTKEIDGFFFYMLALSKHNDNDNPYFPRFHEIKIYKEAPETKQEKIVYSTKMERLENSSYIEENLELKEKMFQRIFGPNVNDKQVSVKYTPSWDIIEAAITKVYPDIYERIVDKDLLRAADFINTLASKNNLMLDLHSDNIMIRDNGQIVITDPLGYSN